MHRVEEQVLALENSSKEIVSTKTTEKVGESSKKLTNAESKVSDDRTKCRNAFMVFIKKILLQRETNVTNVLDTVQTTKETNVENPPIVESLNATLPVPEFSQNVITQNSINNQNENPPTERSDNVAPAQNDSDNVPQVVRLTSLTMVAEVFRVMNMGWPCFGPAHEKCPPKTYEEICLNFQRTGIGKEWVESVIKTVVAYLINECAKHSYS